jgi:pSer/pThr/pTyr-binding forkhead associated (FHA) protein
MVQLRILSNPLAGELPVVRHFPFHIGRAPDNDLVLDASGVWNYHFMVDFKPDQGFTFRTFDEAFATVNDQPQSAARLHNGDIISFGSAKIQFWLAPAVQRGLRLREFSVWTLLAAVTASQVALVCWLIGMK